MSLIDNFLGKQNLQGLTPEQQEQARSQGWNQLLMGTIFGGKGLASGYAAAQQVVPGIQAAQQRRQMGQALQSSFVPVNPNDIGLTQNQVGSQADMLMQQNAEFGSDPVVQRRTVDALQSILPKRFDETVYAKNLLRVMDPTNPAAILKNLADTAPTLDTATNTVRGRFDPSRILSAGPQESSTPGVVRRLNPLTNQMEFVPGVGAKKAIEDTRPIQLAQGEEIIGRTPDGRPIIQNAAGVVSARGQRATADALGAAAGQVEEVYDEESGQMVKVPRTAITGTATGSGRGATGGGGGFAAGPSVQEDVLTKSQGAAFETRVKTINEKGQDASRRSFQSNQLYNTVSQLDPTALTAFGAAVVPYIRAIPGFRDLTDKFATNTALLGQQYASGVLGNFAAVKGNLNAQEVRLVEDASWQKWDPRTATRYVAALESAFADKDAVQMEFANTYQGDFRQYDSSWRNSPQNQSVFNHPMMTRFVTDEINEAIAKTRPGTDPNFNLPPGFSVEGMTRDGGIQVKKPDGSVFVVR